MICLQEMLLDTGFKGLVTEENYVLSKSIDNDALHIVKYQKDEDGLYYYLEDIELTRHIDEPLLQTFKTAIKKLKQTGETK